MLGLAFGLGFYGATLYWILLFGELAWVALVLLCMLSTALFGLVAPAICRRERPLLQAIVLAALWTVVDWIRGSWPLGGFTWGSLGISQVDNRLTVRLATVAGVWGVTFVVVLVNALVLQAIAGGGGGVRRLARVGVALILIAAPVAIPFSVPDGPDLDVATLQVDVDAPQGATMRTCASPA
jgi:apolipoprotein N-acyltransferase